MMGLGRSDHSSMNRIAAEKNSTNKQAPAQEGAPVVSDRPRSENWPDPQEIAEKSNARISLVNQALAEGRDPHVALQEHDASLEGLSTQDRNKRKLCNPSHQERVSGANINTVAANRVGTTFQAVEVQSTMRYLLNHADDLKLGSNALTGLNYIIQNFCEYHAAPEKWDPKPPGANSEWEPTRPIPSEKAFTNASKVVMTFYKDAREYHIKTATLKLGDDPAAEIDMDNPSAMAAQFQEITGRMTEIMGMLRPEKNAIETAAEVVNE